MVTVLEPKGAKTTSYEIYSDDDSVTEIKTKPRKRKTGTQALVEFLNTTSPKEFQKSTQHSKRSPSFFQRQKPKSQNKCVVNLDNVQLVYRKNHIEIITRPTTDTPSSFTKEGFVRQQPSLRFQAIYSQQQQQQQQQDHCFIEQIETTDEHDIVEDGLKQRLALYEQLNLEKPGDTLSKIIAHDYLDTRKTTEYPKTFQKNARHVQIQTMPLDVMSLENAFVTLENQDNKEDTGDSAKSIKKELQEARTKNARLEAALRETHDQLELISGVAYQRLKQMWQEKMMWEQACIQVKEQCWRDHQQHIFAGIDLSDNK
ncbi:hypothetical protein EDC96DRAFT_575543 [Choanephora cucurbitarum]|nr:hypothetical protein EDC96DRAFT_575543 [Choanephora cucurbitarum]